MELSGNEATDVIKIRGLLQNQFKANKISYFSLLSVINIAIYNTDIQQCKVRDNLHVV